LHPLSSTNPENGTGHHLDSYHSDNHHSDSRYSDNLSFSIDATISVNGRSSFCLIGISTRNISVKCSVNVRNTLTLFYTGCFYNVTFFICIVYNVYKFSSTSLHLLIKGWAAQHAVLPFAHLTCNKIKCDKSLLQHLF